MVGFIASTAARSDNRIGPRLATVSSTSISVGVKPWPAVVGRSRREIRLIAERSRAAESTAAVVWSVVLLRSVIVSRN
jgi:hypothetical protein